MDKQRFMFDDTTSIPRNDFLVVSVHSDTKELDSGVFVRKLESVFRAFNLLNMAAWEF